MSAADFSNTQNALIQLETVLCAVDSRMEAFAAKNNLTLNKEGRENWPQRNFVWGETIRLFLQIYLSNPADATFNLWVCGSQDRNHKRYWKNKFLFENQTIEMFRPNIDAFLLEGKNWLDALDEISLEFATEISNPNPS